MIYFNTIKNVTYHLTLLSILVSFNLHAKIQDFETTRLKSTAGAGAGSILMDESTLLNPASIAFYDVSAFYMQKFDQKVEQKNSDSDVVNSFTAKNLGFIASDGEGNLKGSMSYYNFDHDGSKRKRVALSMASIVDKKSALGITYRYTSDKNIKNMADIKYNQMVIGVTHAVSPSFTLGIVYIDPLRQHKVDSKLIAGVQYSYMDFITLMLDLGTKRDDIKGSYVHKEAVQLKVFTDFYLRAGNFYDKEKGEKGNGAGIGWVQPKLVVEFAIKNTEVISNESIKQDNETIKDTSLSLSYRF